MAINTLVSMQVFRAVAELKSFVAAAERMKVSPAMASKHVMHLEERLGARLLNRTSRSVSLTEPGQLYFNQVRQMLDALEEVEGAMTKSTVLPKGTLRVSAPVWAASPRFVAVLADFRQQYPDVRLDLDLTGRLVNLVEEGFDLALRVSQSPGDNLIARPLTTVLFQYVAAPSYLSRAGTPSQLSDLSHHSLLWYHSPTLGELHLPGTEGMKLSSVLRSGNESLLHLSALHGMGLAMLPTWLTSEDLQAGRLVHVLPGAGDFSVPLLCVYPSRKYLSSKVRTFIDFLTEAAGLKG
ncbi:LysR family transcriptional regulator [Xylophilus sp. GW821-FHT01B05]